MTISDYDSVKEVRISRKELYELVWSERLSEISRMYYISENGLIKKCQEWNIPLPNLKYWIQLKDTTNPPTRIPLPQYSGHDMVYLKLRDDFEKTKESIQKKIFNIKKEIEEDSKINFKVPERLSNPDPLIADARDRLYKKEVYNKDQGIIYHNQGSIGIYVTPSQLNRALRFMDTMIKALRNRGHHFINHNGSTHVVIYGEDYQISCQEKTKRISYKNEYGSQESKLEPTGLLSFRLGESYFLKEWTEGETLIEEQVSKILASVEYRGWKDQQERIENEKRWAIQREKERIVKELQERKDKELVDFKKLFKESKRHEEAEIIRRYIQKLEDAAILRNELNEELKQKIEWARKKADWYDPFIEANDELLIDVNREDLTMAKRGYW